MIISIFGLLGATSPQLAAGAHQRGVSPQRSQALADPRDERIASLEQVCILFLYSCMVRVQI